VSATHKRPKIQDEDIFQTPTNFDGSAARGKQQ
jgi:hypothetical protein